MEVPPPHYMPPPPKKKNTGLIVGLIIGGVLLCCLLPIGLFVFGGLAIFNNTKPLLVCGTAFADLNDSVREYAQDHQGALPDADKWQDEVRPYYDKISKRKAEQNPFGTMSVDGTWGCDNGSGGKTGIAFNDAIAGKKWPDLTMSSDVVLFEIESATANAHQTFSPPNVMNSPHKMFNQPLGWFLVRAGQSPKLYGPGGKETPFNTRGG